MLPKHMPISVDARIHASIKRFAAFEGISMSRFIGAVLWSGYMKKGALSKVHQGIFDLWCDNALQFRNCYNPAENGDRESHEEFIKMEVQDRNDLLVKNAGQGYRSASRKSAFKSVLPATKPASRSSLFEPRARSVGRY